MAAWLELMRLGDDAPVTPASAMKIAAVWACVQVLSRSISGLPLVLIEQNGSQRRRAVNHPLFRILHTQPNPEMTSITLRSTLMAHLLLYGNAYVQIVRSNGGRVLELWPQLPSQIDVGRDEATKELIYKLRQDSGIPRTFRAYEIMHVQSLSPDGITGYSPVDVVLSTFERKRLLEQYEAAFWRNGARPGMVLKSTAAPNDKQAAALIESWEQRFKGAINSGKTALLPSHLSLETVGIPQTDAQFLESQKFSRSEIASIFGVPPHMIGDLDRATFSNISDQNQSFIDQTLGWWAETFQQSIQTNLLAGAERDRYYPKFILQALLKGNPSERSQFYSTGLQNGYFCINDVRELEDMPPVPDGDTYFVPLNMIPVSQAIEGPQTPAAPAAAARSAECTCGHDHGDHETRADEPAPQLTDGEKEKQQRLLANRQRLARSQIGLFDDAATRIIRRERRDVERAAAKMLKQRSVSDFLAWLRTFYADDGEFCQAIRDVFRPLLTSLATQAETSAANELGQDDEGMTDAAREFVEEYLDSIANQHAARSRIQMEELLTDAQADGVDELPAVTERLNQWEQDRPQRIAMKYAFEALNALVIFSYRRHSVTYLRWLASGASCSFCLGLSGQVAGIDSYFVEGGATLDGGEAGQMTVTGNKRHGPLHRGCDCIVVAA